MFIKLLIKFSHIYINAGGEGQVDTLWYFRSSKVPSRHVHDMCIIKKIDKYYINKICTT